MIRVAIVEDCREELDHLQHLLSVSPGFACVAACSSAAEAMEILPDLSPDIILMDIQLPGVSGIECVRRLRPVLPETQFMMLTILEDHDLIFRSLAAGATGYLLKKAPSAQLLEAIRELHAGGAPMSGQVARKVVAAFRQPPAAAPAAPALSPAEETVLQQLARGLLYKEVAEVMNLSSSTVRTHVWHIYQKLQVHNRTEAVLKAREMSRGLPRPATR
jgi:DNA-binding NarL/FixJ family response regulator